MRIFTILFISSIFAVSLTAQNSYINNYSFEITDWQSIAWFSNTNTGSPVIVNQNEPFFTKDDIRANSGISFAYIGGVQSPAGLYEGQLAQEFNLPVSGDATISFYVRYIRESVDPGSVITVRIDGEIVWSINPHYIVDASENYEMVSVEVGRLEVGTHNIEIFGYENPLGGDAPMQFAFDDFVLQASSTASINESENIGLSVICTPGNVQIQTQQDINQDVVIEFLDFSGKIISTNVTYFQNSYSLPVSSLSTGMYILNLKTTNQTFSRKLFIQH